MSHWHLTSTEVGGASAALTLFGVWLGSFLTARSQARSTRNAIDAQTKLASDDRLAAERRELRERNAARAREQRDVTRAAYGRILMALSRSEAASLELVQLSEHLTEQDLYARWMAKVTNNLHDAGDEVMMHGSDQLSVAVQSVGEPYNDLLRSLIHLYRQTPRKARDEAWIYVQPFTDAIEAHLVSVRQIIRGELADLPYDRRNNASKGRGLCRTICSHG
jgi:type VI protein secretion system component VasK